MRLKVFFIFIFLFIQVNPLFAETGQELFYNNCLKCHRAKNQVIAPVDKASSQWRRFFKRNKHQRRYKIDLSPIVSEMGLKKIIDFLIDHASDSDQPQVAGMR